MGKGVLARALSVSLLDVVLKASTKVARRKRVIRALISALIMTAAMPRNEAPPAAEAKASPTISMPLHFEKPRVVGISPTRAATQKTPQARSAAAWWSRVATVQTGPRHEVAPVTIVASQIVQKSSTGTMAQSAH
jgi:hypothetical protein